MSSYTNTIDSLGDSVVIDSIIDRSITEFVDDKLTDIGNYAFQSCDLLTKVVLPNVETIGVNSFNGCSLLEYMDLGKVMSIADSGIGWTTSLKALIIRSESKCALSSTCFYNNAITKKTGYLYVPANLVDVYKNYNILSKYADQIRALEDYTVDGTITGELDESKI